MATETGTASSRRNYWQLPLFVVGVCAMVAALQLFPLTPLSAAERFMKELAQLEKAIDRRPIDMGHLQELAPEVAAAAEDYPEYAQSAHSVAGQAYILLARNEPMNQDYWSHAETELQKVKGENRSDYLLALAQAAVGESGATTVGRCVDELPQPQRNGRGTPSAAGRHLLATRPRRITRVPKKNSLCI